MRRATACLWIGLCGCQRLNPAFDVVDEVADEDSSESVETSQTDSTEESDSETSVNPTETSESESESESETTDPTDTDAPCPDPEMLCDGTCIDVSNDPLNCGACGEPCPENHVCAEFACLAAKRVFVTSVPFSANFNGIAAADEFCNLVAGSAQLDGTFKAWLSSPNNSPKQDFTKTSAYVRTDGAFIASSWEDLTDGFHPNPIDTDEGGGPLPGIAACGIGSGAWSGTTITGEFAGGPNCLNWTTSMITESGKLGDVLAMDEKWADVGDCTAVCSTPLPIYCFEQ